MSVDRFQVVLKLANIEDNDKVWFGRWLRRYAVFLRQPETELLQSRRVRRVIETHRGLMLCEWCVSKTRRTLLECAGGHPITRLAVP